MTARKPVAASWPLIRRLLTAYVAPQRGDIAVALFFMLIASAMTGAMAKLMEPVIDKVFTAQDPDMLMPVALTIFAAFAARGLSTYFYSTRMTAIGQRIVTNIKKDMFAQLMRADLAAVQGGQSGDFQARFLSDAYIIRSTLNDALSGVGRNFFTLLFLIGLMFAQDWKLSLISIFVFPFAGWIVMTLGRRLRRIAGRMQDQMGAMTSILGQAYRGAKLIKAYGMEEYESKRSAEAFEKIFDLVKKSNKLSAISTPLAEILSGFAIVAVVIYGGHQVLRGEATAGQLFSFIAAFLLAFEPMKKLARLNNATQMGLAAAERLFALIDAPVDVADRVGAEGLILSKPEISFEHVSFAYRDGTLALQDVSFQVKAGQTVALVGESGAGKSTILNLIPRFYDPQSGAVRVGGRDAREVTLASLRGVMALVSQDVSIFNDTVRDNIRYGRPGATDAEVEAAAQAAVAHDFILELPQGYDTFVGENGVNLSGGQKQRIAIARAMLRDAPILLLDEATSALDTHSERLVQTALDRLRAGKTTVVVAHRLSTIMNADVIFVMAGGKIVEQGTHDQLLAAGGAYARLYGALKLKESA